MRCGPLPWQRAVDCPKPALSGPWTSPSLFLLKRSPFAQNKLASGMWERQSHTRSRGRIARVHGPRGFAARAVDAAVLPSSLCRIVYLQQWSSHHPSLSPRVCSSVLLEKLYFHEHQHGTHGRQQGDFRPFQPASLAGRISFTNRAPLLWNMVPREVETSCSMLVFKKKVLSLLDSPVSGKNLVHICFGSTTI